MLWDHQLKLYKSSFSDKGNKTMPKECLVVWLLAFKCFKIFDFNFLTPYFWGTINLVYKRSFLLKKLLKRYRTLDTLHASPFQNKIVTWSYIYFSVFKGMNMTWYFKFIYSLEKLWLCQFKFSTYSVKAHYNDFIWTSH